MMSNLLILPMLLPFLCALILVFTKIKPNVENTFYYDNGCYNVNFFSIIIYVVNHKPITLDFGGWKAPLVFNFR